MLMIKSSVKISPTTTTMINPSLPIHDMDCPRAVWAPNDLRVSMIRSFSDYLRTPGNLGQGLARPCGGGDGGKPLPLSPGVGPGAFDFVVIVFVFQ